MLSSHSPQAGGKHNPTEGQQQRQELVNNSAQNLPEVNPEDTDHSALERCIIQLRLLLSERLLQAKQHSATNGTTDCSILENSICSEYSSRFGQPLTLTGTRFGKIRELVMAKCLDIVACQQLKVREGMQMGYVPCLGFKVSGEGIYHEAEAAYRALTSIDHNGKGDAETRETPKPGGGGQVSDFIASHGTANCMQAAIRTCIIPILISISSTAKHLQLMIEVKTPAEA